MSHLLVLAVHCVAINANTGTQLTGNEGKPARRADSLTGGRGRHAQRSTLGFRHTHPLLWHYFRAHYQPVQAQACPIPDGSFDVVVSNQVLEHVEDLDAVLKEIHRVLKVGGTFCCSLLEIRRSFLARFASLRHIEEDYIAFRLRERNCGGGSRLAQAAPLKYLSRWACRRLAGLVLVAVKDQKPVPTR